MSSRTSRNSRGSRNARSKHIARDFDLIDTRPGFGLYRPSRDEDWTDVEEEPKVKKSISVQASVRPANTNALRRNTRDYQAPLSSVNNFMPSGVSDNVTELATSKMSAQDTTIGKEQTSQGISNSNLLPVLSNAINTKDPKAVSFIVPLEDVSRESDRANVLPRNRVIRPSNSQHSTTVSSTVSQELHVSRSMPQATNMESLNQYHKASTSFLTERTELRITGLARTLLESITGLEIERRLKSEGTPTDFQPPQVFYSIGNGYTVYRGEPSWKLTKDGVFEPSRKDPVGSLEQFINYNRQILFIIYRVYAPYLEANTTVEHDTVSPPRFLHERIIPISSNMMEALSSLQRCSSIIKNEEGLSDLALFEKIGMLTYPYLFWYHWRTSKDWTKLSKPHVRLLMLIAVWVDLNHGQEHRSVDDLRARDVITASSIHYLTLPGDVVVTKNQDGLVQAYITTGWFTYDHRKERSKRQARQINRERHDWITWSIRAWHLTYTGRVHRSDKILQMNFKSDQVGKEIYIRDLQVVPLHFADRTIVKTLQTRGETFWRCIGRKLVSYCEPSSSGTFPIVERYMIDLQTYMLQAKRDDTIAHRLSRWEEIEVGNASYTDVERPKSPELYVVPPQITGFNLRTKQWLDLEVDRICPVVWNKKAFEYLVIDFDTKELMMALVVKKLAAERDADLIENKGKGLIILLHGPPGTGKTLTAESVAEIAERPLLRITCGDLGTKPEAVERHLDSMLHFAEIWDCITLLDEADVFLARRTAGDLERNALVSIFLRVLDYYQGILVLTSNQVHTLDEAFKSRIVLTLQYDNLGKAQRSKIWKNFFRKFLETREKDIDFSDVESHIEDLARYEISGRQIRNAITTARQLARFQQVLMSYEHIRRSIEVMGGFNNN